LRNEELLQLLIPRLRADFALCQKYIYKREKPFNYPITAFGGLQDEHVPCDRIVAWSAQTCSIFKLHFFAGDHFFLHKEQPSLLRIISQELLKI
jgi:medium-chain acyl-[acyl-carrier-protein] hydrolase